MSLELEVNYLKNLNCFEATEDFFALKKYFFKHK